MSENIYKEFILELSRNPLNKGQLSDFDVEKDGINPSCGDDIKIQIKFGKDSRVEDVKFQGKGCAISQAASSLVTDDIKGKTKEEILKLDEEYVISLLGVNIMYTRKKCALLCLNTIQEAVKQTMK
jgi:nitrogen fixation NifU-like protein